jgi:hypothetical protein
MARAARRAPALEAPAPGALRLLSVVLTRRLMLGSQGADGTVTPQPMAVVTRRRWTNRK